MSRTVASDPARSIKGYAPYYGNHILYVALDITKEDIINVLAAFAPDKINNYELKDQFWVTYIFKPLKPTLNVLAPLRGAHVGLKVLSIHCGKHYMIAAVQPDDHPFDGHIADDKSDEDMSDTGLTHVGNASRETYTITLGKIKNPEGMVPPPAKAMEAFKEDPHEPYINMHIDSVLTFVTLC